MKMRWKLLILAVPVVALIVIQLLYTEKRKALRELDNVTVELKKMRALVSRIGADVAACKSRQEAVCRDSEIDLENAKNDVESLEDQRCLILFDLKDMGEDVDITGCK